MLGVCPLGRPRLNLPDIDALDGIEQRPRPSSTSIAFSTARADAFSSFEVSKRREPAPESTLGRFECVSVEQHQVTQRVARRFSKFDLRARFVRRDMSEIVGRKIYRPRRRSLISVSSCQNASSISLFMRVHRRGRFGPIRCRGGAGASWGNNLQDGGRGQPVSSGASVTGRRRDTVNPRWKNVKGFLIDDDCASHRLDGRRMPWFSSRFRNFDFVAPVDFGKRRG